MQIDIRLYGTLRNHLPEEKRGKTSMTLSSDAIIQDVLDELGIADYVIVAVNDEQERDPNSGLQAGDMLRIFEVAAGG